jgi:signal transduction histidine kinase
MFYRILILFLFSYSCFSQTNIDDEALQAYLKKDSANYYFFKLQKKLKTKSDTASYLYFKFFRKYNNDEFDSAFYFSKKLIPILKKLDTINRLRKVHETLYLTHLKKGRYNGALKEILKTLALAEKLKDTSLITLHYSDISILHHDFDQFEKGIEYGKKGVAIMNSAKNKDYKHLIFTNNAIAINFDDWNKPDSALFYHYKNVELLKKVEDSLQFAFIYNNIANTNLKIENFTIAKRYLKRSLAINKIRNRSYNLASNYTNLATIAYKENNNILAKQYFKEASFYAKKSNSIEKIRDLLEQEYHFYKKNKNYKLALAKKEAFFALKDSVYKSNRVAEFSKLEVEYKTAKIEKENAQQREVLLEKELEIKNKTFYTSLLTGSLLLISIIFIAVYKQNQLKRTQLQKEIEFKDALATIKTQNRLQEQRLRISRDLHDNIGSQLTFIISSLDNLKFISKDLNDKLKDKLTSISSFTSETIYQLRDTIWAMNKNEISIEDLHTRILSFVEKAKNAVNKTNFEVNYTIDTTISFSSLVGMNIFRVIQEAINNAIKYAEAKTISIKIENNQNDIIISVKDDGIGFSITEITLGNGLSNMEKRMSEIKGKILIDSKKGVGTTIVIKRNTAFDV